MGSAGNVLHENLSPFLDRSILSIFIDNFNLYNFLDIASAAPSTGMLRCSPKEPLLASHYDLIERSLGEMAVSGAFDNERSWRDPEGAVTAGFTRLFRPKLRIPQEYRHVPGMNNAADVRSAPASSII
jgi:hypothetical protein